MSIAISVKKYSAVFSALCLMSSCAVFNKTYTVSEQTEEYFFAPAWTDQRKAHRVDSSAEAQKNLYFVSSSENANKRPCLKEAEKQAIQKAAVDTADDLLHRMKEEKKKNNKVHISPSLKDRLKSNILVNLYDIDIAGEYWEKRNYLKEKGADKDYTAYKCDVVVKIPKKKVIEAVKICAEKVSQTMKHNTKKAMEASAASYAVAVNIEN